MTRRNALKKTKKNISRKNKNTGGAPPLIQIGPSCQSYVTARVITRILKHLGIIEKYEANDNSKDDNFEDHYKSLTCNYEVDDNFFRYQYKYVLKQTGISQANKTIFVKEMDYFRKALVFRYLLRLNDIPIETGNSTFLTNIAKTMFANIFRKAIKGDKDKDKYYLDLDMKNNTHISVDDPTNVIFTDIQIHRYSNKPYYIDLNADEQNKFIEFYNRCNIRYNYKTDDLQQKTDYKEVIEKVDKDFNGMIDEIKNKLEKEKKNISIREYKTPSQFRQFCNDYNHKTKTNIVYTLSIMNKNSGHIVIVNKIEINDKELVIEVKDSNTTLLYDLTLNIVDDKFSYQKYQAKDDTGKSITGKLPVVFDQLNYKDCTFIFTEYKIDNIESQVESTKLRVKKDTFEEKTYELNFSVSDFKGLTDSLQVVKIKNEISFSIVFNIINDNILSIKNIGVGITGQPEILIINIPENYISLDGLSDENKIKLKITLSKNETWFDYRKTSVVVTVPIENLQTIDINYVYLPPEAEEGKEVGNTITLTHVPSQQGGRRNHRRKRRRSKRITKKNRRKSKKTGTR